MAPHAVTFQGGSIRQACQIFAISECCYRYTPVLHIENQYIADWLIHGQLKKLEGTIFTQCERVQVEPQKDLSYLLRTVS